VRSCQYLVGHLGRVEVWISCQGRTSWTKGFFHRFVHYLKNSSFQIVAPDQQKSLILKADI
jgi:hypothetical protein